jgi:4-hydroxy-3-methylbut-2-enyl diphosphate reductase
VELCEEKLPTYFIRSEEDIISSKEICHFNLHKNKPVTTISFLPEKKPARILITSGASCPDAIVEGVINKLLSFYNVSKTVSEITGKFA